MEATNSTKLSVTLPINESFVSHHVPYVIHQEVLVANKSYRYQHCLEQSGWIQREKYQLEGDTMGIVNQWDFFLWSQYNHTILCPPETLN
jgi:hypothetical protein